MVRYYKHLEDPNIAMHMRFYDRFGNELKSVIELDPDQYDGNANGKRINEKTGLVEDCFYPDAIVEVDSVVNPSEDHLDAFRTLQKAKHFSLLPHEEKQAMIKDMVKALTKVRALDR